MLGNLIGANLITIMQAALWVESIVLGLDPPTWSASILPLFWRAMGEISSKSPADMEVMCAWELGLFREQDLAEGVPDRDYQGTSVEFWMSLRWRSLYDDLHTKYNPLFAVLL